MLNDLAYTKFILVKLFRKLFAYKNMFMEPTSGEL